MMHIDSTLEAEINLTQVFNDSKAINHLSSNTPPRTNLISTEGKSAVKLLNYRRSPDTQGLVAEHLKKYTTLCYDYLVESYSKQYAPPGIFHLKWCVAKLSQSQRRRKSPHHG